MEDSQSSKKRPRKIRSKFTQASSFYMRLWYSKTNTYSETVFVNNSMFYKYSSEEKAAFRPGMFIKVKEANNDIKAIILCKGTFEAMEALEPYLEDMAEERVETSEVLKRIDDQYKKISAVESSSSDSDSLESDVSPPSLPLEHLFTQDATEQFEKEQKWLSELSRE